MRRLLVVTILTVGLSTPSSAGHCPEDIKRIDEVVATAEGLSSEQLSEIMRLRNKGETWHEIGSHGVSIRALHKALKMLGIEPH